MYSGVLAPGGAILGAAGLVVLAAALVTASAELLPWGVGLVAGGYALALVLTDGDLDARAGFVAAGLLLTAELAYWAVEARRWPREEAAATGVRLAGIVIVALGTATVGTLLVAAGAALPAGAALVQFAGVLGAVGALVALALLARR